MLSLNEVMNLCNAIKMNKIEIVRSVISKDREIVKPGGIHIPQGMLSPLWEAMLGGHAWRTRRNRKASH